MKKLVLSLVSAVVMIAGLSTTAFAAAPTDAIVQNNDNTVVIEADMDNPNYLNEVKKAFDDPSILQVMVIDPSLANSEMTEFFPEPRDWDSYSVHPGSARKTGSFVGTNELARAQGGPGMTLSISQTKTVGNSFSCSFSVAAGAVSNVVGFNVSASESISVSGSAEVPATYNGQKVNTMTLIAYPLYDVYTFDVDHTIHMGGGMAHTWDNTGTGTANKAIGCSFNRTYA